mgnify:CR=1 FL=1
MEISKSHGLTETALHFRQLKQGLISSNIANIDTPFYKARDINFGQIIEAEKVKVFNEKDKNKLTLTTTSSKHYEFAKDSQLDSKAQLFFRDGHLSKNDGNSVDLDTETTELSKNASYFKALIALMKKQESMFKYAIESSSKLS